MFRSKSGNMPRLFSFLVLISTALPSMAGPIGALPVNVTSLDLGMKPSESCAVGDLVYMSGDEFPGSTPCDQCRCGDGKVQCTRQRCEPRAGCKAIHRPDHCCPIYQCECEQEGRVYGNGEKLIDPADPCRVCYCQGGEVVCRRIACFLRDDCKPRLVPGRCCPEYDNCPLRGVTAGSALTPSISTASPTEKKEHIKASPPTKLKEVVKQEITIKEITPVSEIPVLSGVKIKEILPSPSIEVAEYSSSKAPLTPREINTEKPASNTDDVTIKTETQINKEIESSSSNPILAKEQTESMSKDNMDVTNINKTNKIEDSYPSKISLSVQDSINAEIGSSSIPSITTVLPISTKVDQVIPISTKAPVTEEEDTSFFDHNPAFPPIPDDLSVLSNHGDEIVPEPSMDNDHIHITQDVTSQGSTSSSPKYNIYEVTTKKSTVTASKVQLTSIEQQKSVLEVKETTSERQASSTGTPSKDSPMLNLRSALPTEILNVPSSVTEDITGEVDEEIETSTINIKTYPEVTTESSIYQSEYTQKQNEESILTTEATRGDPELTSISSNAHDTTTTPKPKTTVELTFDSMQGSAATTKIQPEIITEANIQTEEASTPKQQIISSTHQTIVSDNALTTGKVSTTAFPIESSSTEKMLTASPTSYLINENAATEEFPSTTVLIQTTTQAVEIIQPINNSSKSASIIETQNVRKNNVLTDLINLVGDVASIGDHTDTPDTTVAHSSATLGISESEELLPVNAGYKSKNSNRNVNSITEIPIKSKAPGPVTKLKTVEIEGEDEESITDSPPPFDKVEPTTKRPIIDNVSDNDNMPIDATTKTDIEIINKSYVPTINKRPTKVVMKKNSDKVEVSDDQLSDQYSLELTTEDILKSSSSESSTSDYATYSVEMIERITDKINLTSSTILQ